MLPLIYKKMKQDFDSEFETLLLKIFNALSEKSHPGSQLQQLLLFEF